MNRCPTTLFTERAFARSSARTSKRTHRRDSPASAAMTRLGDCVAFKSPTGSTATAGSSTSVAQTGFWPSPSRTGAANGVCSSSPSVSISLRASSSWLGDDYRSGPTASGSATPAIGATRRANASTSYTSCSTRSRVATTEPLSNTTWNAPSTAREESSSATTPLSPEPASTKRCTNSGSPRAAGRRAMTPAAASAGTAWIDRT